MLIFVCNVVFWIIFVYGFLSLAQDIFNEITYKNVKRDESIFLLIKNLYGNLDSYIYELNLLKRCLGNRVVSIVDLNENDDLDYVDNILKKEKINWEIFNIKDGKKLILNHFEEIEKS